MPDRAWTGSIFLRDEGGFELVMRALNHYNRRLRRISASPEIAGAGAMFGSVLDAEAARTAPQLGAVAARLRAGLADPKALAAVEGDIGVIEKAMTCYRSDAAKASADGAHAYYAKLVEGNVHYREDAAAIDGALAKLKGYH